MAPKSFLFNLDRRKKQIIVVLLCLYTLVVFHYNDRKFETKFRSTPKLPTSSHSQDIDLKTYTSNGDTLQDLRDQLSFTFPYEPEKPIPRRVWQTWKVGVNSAAFPSELKAIQKEWTAKVADSELFQYSLIPDDHIEPFLQNLYGEIPLVIDAFKLMPRSILKADFLRYLLLYARGGIYSDIDTAPLKSLDSWLSVDPVSLKKFKSGNKPIPYKNYAKATENVNPGLVIGIEADPDREDWNDWYARRIQFCQWTIQSKPGHPALRELILNITATTLNSVAGNKKSIRQLIEPEYLSDYNVNFRDKRGRDTSYAHDALKNNDNVDGTDIMNWTGPGIFSDIILTYMNNLIQNHNDVLLLNGNLESTRDVGKSTKKFYRKISKSLQSQNEVPWEFFSLMDQPVLVDDILVLPITSFSPDVGQMGSKSSSDEMAYVRHMFKGSWKEEADSNQDS